MLTEQIDEMNNSIQSSLNDSDFSQRMDSISSDLSSLCSDIDDIKSSVCYGYGSSIAFDIGDIKREISSIGSAVDEIHFSVSDKYSYDSLASNIDDIRSAVNGVKDAIESHY